MSKRNGPRWKRKKSYKMMKWWRRRRRREPEAAAEGREQSAVAPQEHQQEEEEEEEEQDNNEASDEQIMQSFGLIPKSPEPPTAFMPKVTCPDKEPQQSALLHAPPPEQTDARLAFIETLAFIEQRLSQVGELGDLIGVRQGPF